MPTLLSIIAAAREAQQLEVQKHNVQLEIGGLFSEEPPQEEVEQKGSRSMEMKVVYLVEVFTSKEVWEIWYSTSDRMKAVEYFKNNEEYEDNIRLTKTTKEVAG